VKYHYNMNNHSSKKLGWAHFHALQVWVAGQGLKSITWLAISRMACKAWADLSWELQGM
jgi:hypothetical protein